jgi:hypothetical protein
MARIVTTITTAVVLSGLIFATTVHADNEFACSVYASVASGFLSNNLGISFTKEAALFNVTECAHMKSGLYGNAFLLIPIEKVNDGKEFDFRAGYRPKLSGFPLLEVDGSLAIYAFTEGSKDLYTFNARLEIGHTFVLSPTVKLRLHGTGDYQHSLTVHTDSLGLSAGTSLSADLPTWGNPTLGLGAEVWNYPLSSDRGKGPIGSFTADLRFKIPGTSIIIGPRAHVTIDDIEGSRKVRFVGGMFVLVPFGF